MKKKICYKELKEYICNNGGASFMTKNIYHHNKATNKFHSGTEFYLYIHLSQETLKKLKEEFGNIITGTSYYRDRPEEVFQTITIFKECVEEVVKGENYHFV